MRITIRLLISVLFASMHPAVMALRDGKPNIIVIYANDHGWPAIVRRA